MDILTILNSGNDKTKKQVLYKFEDILHNYTHRQLIGSTELIQYNLIICDENDT